MCLIVCRHHVKVQCPWGNLHLCCVGSEATGYTVRLVETCYLDTPRVRPLMEALSRETGIKHSFYPDSSTLGDGYLFDNGLDPYRVRAFVLGYGRA
jgi:hypothetical protein